METVQTPQPQPKVDRPLDETESKSTDWTKIILVAVLGLGLLAGSAYAGYYYGIQQVQPVKELIPAVSQPTPTPTPEATPSPTLPQPEGEVIVPEPLVDTSNWQKKDYPNLGIALKTPPEWQEGSRLENSVHLRTDPGSTIPTFFMIKLYDNPHSYGRRDFLWKELLSYKISLAEGIEKGYIRPAREWVIDGVSSLSLMYLEYSGGGDNLVVPRGDKMLVLFISHSEFSEERAELFTVLSTIDLK